MRYFLIIFIAILMSSESSKIEEEIATDIKKVDELSVRRLYDKIFGTLNSVGYDRRIRPFLGVKAVEVTVFMRVLSLRSISEATMDYRLELFFRERWLDPRLAYDAETFDNITEISLHESLAERIWMPDTFMPNAVKSRNPNRESITHRSLLRLHPDGTILSSRRLSITAECPMDLTLYPFDQQVCVLSIESYGHSTKELFYEWLNERPVAMDDLQLPEYQLKRVVTRSHNVTVATGTYSRLECCFFFERSAGFFFIQLFLPATAIVFTSWILLCMGRGSNFSDMIEIILAVTFLYFSYTAMMPRVSYVKAMDIYLGACFLHVFLSMTKMAATKFYEDNFAEPEPGPMVPRIYRTEPVNGPNRNELRTPECDEKMNRGEVYVCDSPAASSEKRFRYAPTHSSVDVTASASMIDGKQKINSENCCTYWKRRICKRILGVVARIPDNVILLSFLIFWAAYLLACFWWAVDTNEERCYFS